MSTTEGNTLLSCDSVELRAGYRPLIRNFSVHLESGQSLAIVGPNGFGKTTLLRTLCGISRPYRGRVFINGQMMWPEKSSHLRADLCFLASQPALFLDHSVLSNVEFYLRSMGRELNQSQVMEALRTVGLAEHARQTSRTLSTGQKRRLTIAFLILAKPALVLLDEPTNGLDTQGIDLCLSWLESARSSGVGILIATHDPSLIAWSGRSVDLKEFVR